MTFSRDLAFCGILQQRASRIKKSGAAQLDFQALCARPAAALDERRSHSLRAAQIQAGPMTIEPGQKGRCFQNGFQHIKQVSVAHQNSFPSDQPVSSFTWTRVAACYFFSTISDLKCPTNANISPFSFSATFW